MQLKLRLDAADALRLRLGAEAAGRSQSDFVVSLLAGPHTTIGVGDDPAAALAQVSRLTGTISTAAEILRLARADLGRAGGLVKRLFETTTTAAQHRESLNAAVSELRESIATADAAIEAFGQVTVDIRNEAQVTVRRLSQIG